MGEGRQYQATCLNKASRPLQHTHVGHWSSCLIPSPSIQVTAVCPSWTRYLLDKTLPCRKAVICCCPLWPQFPLCRSG